jgi:putative heme-binding domain-containing protein
MQRLPPARRWAVLEALAREPLDIDEAYFDHMVWYALEPLAAADPARAAALLGKDTLFMVNEYLARRLVSLPGDQGAQGLERVLSRLLEPGLRQCVQETLRGVAAGLKGLKQVPMPPSWEKLYPRLLAEKFPETPGFPGVRDLATGLAVQFGDKRALAVLRRTVTDSTAATPARTAALLTLVTNQGADLPPLLQGLLADPALRSAALRGLAVVPDDATPAAILRHYPSLTSAEKADALQTLASRPAFARALLDALEKGALDRRDLSAFTVRQLLNLKDPALSDRLTRLYGVIRPAAQDYPEKLAKYKKLLTPDTLKAANLANGRRIFANTCGKCHALFGEGGGLGPDLTGSQRANLDYLLENVLDPSAVVPREYQVSVFSLKNGRTINGIVKEEGPKTLVIQTLNETITVAKDDIEDRAQTKQSIMPDGLLDPLSKEEVRDLVGYLASPVQVR